MNQWQLRKLTPSPLSLGWTQGSQAPLQFRADPEFHSKPSMGHTGLGTECLPVYPSFQKASPPVLLAPEVLACEGGGSLSDLTTDPSLS